MQAPITLVKGVTARQMTAGRPAVFLDKDGTVVKDVPFNVRGELIEVPPETLEGLRELASAGYPLIIVSNQSGLALGIFTQEELEEYLLCLSELLLSNGVPLTAIFYCPHHVQGVVSRFTESCSCRKPLHGLFLEAKALLGIDLSSSWMIGDILHDVEAGHRAGCRSILIDNGNETEWDLNSPLRVPLAKVKSINEAARVILDPLYRERCSE